jgi:FkbM family methyltransferase
MLFQSEATSFHSLLGSELRIKVVDIGANPIDGTPPYASLLQGGHADVVGFEPNSEARKKLNTLKGPHEIYLPFAVGDGRSHTLRFCQAPGMTSLLEPNQAVLGLFHGFEQWGRVISTETVQTVRLDDLDETRDVDLIKIDIQGGELMALSHALNRVRNAVVIQTEVEFMPLYVDQPLYSDVDTFLRQQGFMLHRFFPTVSRVIRPLLVDNNIYAGLSQMVWADAVFIRDITRLDLLSDDNLLDMAAILHECYRSIDVVLYLLVEHDRRKGTDFAGMYLTGIKSAVALPVDPNGLPQLR